MPIRLRRIIPVLALIIVACSPEHDQEGLDSYFESFLSRQNRQLTDVIVADIFTPPVASRIYAYSNVAAYEGMSLADSALPSLAGRLNGLKPLPKPNKSKDYYYPLVSATAFSRTAKSLVYNLEKVEAVQYSITEKVLEIGIDEEIYSNSIALGEKIGEHILKWAAEDGYLRRTALPRYSVKDDPSRWSPTPPDYADAIEPHWNTLRPFVMDSVGQFDPGLPTEFDTSKDSQFFKEALEVYETVAKKDSTQLEIAKFWDCNPNISYTQGHVMYFKQQISPGGHWVHITAQILEDEKSDNVYAAVSFAKVSVAIADAFISCWDQKYKSKLVRPETYINKYIDRDWIPVLQTPAFPEHTSGHSVASSAAATVLTDIFGDNYAFVDATETPYGLPVRSYQSFYKAAEEAAISRLYGGIHYKPAIELGVLQGKQVGNLILRRLN